MLAMAKKVATKERSLEVSVRWKGGHLVIHQIQTSLVSPTVTEEEEEKWNKQPQKRKSCAISGYYSEPPAIPINFNVSCQKSSNEYEGKGNLGT